MKAPDQGCHAVMFESRTTYSSTEDGPRHNSGSGGASDVRITLRDVIKVVLSGKWILVSVALVSTGIGVLYLLAVPSRYDVSMTIVPVEEAPADLFGQLELQNGLAGLTFGSARPGRAEAYFAAIGTVALADRFVKEEDVYRRIFAAHWDEEHGRWNEPEEGWVGAVYRLLGHPRNLRVPSSKDLAAFFDEELTISAANDAGMREVRIRYEDPVFAVRLLEMVHQKIDEMLREDALERTQAYISYIKTALAQETVNEYRVALIQVLAEQQKKQMALKVDQPFVARMFDPPTASRQPTSPNILLTLAFSTFFGIGAGMAIVFTRAYFREERLEMPD